MVVTAVNIIIESNLFIINLFNHLLNLQEWVSEQSLKSQFNIFVSETAKIKTNVIALQI